MRERVYTAVIVDGQILMVWHVHDGRDYWTLPGGAVEPGEPAISAARREVREETGIEVVELRQLYVDGHETCFLATCDPAAVAIVGYDPELTESTQWIRGV